MQTERAGRQAGTTRHWCLNISAQTFTFSSRAEPSCCSLHRATCSPPPLCLSLFPSLLPSSSSSSALSSSSSSSATSCSYMFLFFLAWFDSICCTMYLEFSFNKMTKKTNLRASQKSGAAEKFCVLFLTVFWGGGAFFCFCLIFVHYYQVIFFIFGIHLFLHNCMTVKKQKVHCFCLFSKQTSTSSPPFPFYLHLLPPACQCQRSNREIPPPTRCCSALRRAHCVACRPAVVSHSPGANNSASLRGSLNSPGAAQSCKSERLLLSLCHAEGTGEKPSCRLSQFEVEQGAAAAVYFLFQERHFRVFFKRANGVLHSDTDTHTLSVSNQAFETCKLWTDAKNRCACVLAAIHEFPEDIFTKEQRQNGAVVLHALCVSSPHQCSVTQCSTTSAGVCLVALSESLLSHPGYLHVLRSGHRLR